MKTGCMSRHSSRAPSTLSEVLTGSSAGAPLPARFASRAARRPSAIRPSRTPCLGRSTTSACRSRTSGCGHRRRRAVRSTGQPRRGRPGRRPSFCARPSLSTTWMRVTTSEWLLLPGFVRKEAAVHKDHVQFRLLIGELPSTLGRPSPGAAGSRTSQGRAPSCISCHRSS